MCRMEVLLPIQLTGVLMVITFFQKDTNRPVNKKTDINRSSERLISVCCF